MKTVIKYTLAATLVAGTSAAGHNHHQFHHRELENRGGSPVLVERDEVTAYVAGPTATVYEVAGKVIDAAEAKAGLSKGEYVVIGETTPTYTPPPPPPKPTTTKVAAEFFESTTTSTTSTSTSTSTTSTSTSKTSSTPPPPPATSSAAPTVAASSESATSGGQGLTADFPSGKVSCSTFPSQYGAIPLDWLNLGGWSSLQYVPDWSDALEAISEIIGGAKCDANTFCSYACPPGYQKSQWPKTQGATGQSVGGLLCNSDGYLELTNSEYSTLCIPGAGGVSIQNDLTQGVATCRTDYPASENMVIPAFANPGSTVALCNPEQDSYYQWEGKATSAQYYINPPGCSEEDCCVWTSPTFPTSGGNWAAMIAGVGKASDGTTYLSIFQNSPTSSAKLPFNVEITGDVTTKCSWIDGVWTGGSNGCTTGLAPGGSAVFRYF